MGGGLPPGVITIVLLGVGGLLAFEIGVAAHDNSPLVAIIVLALPAVFLLVTSRLEQAVFIFLIYATFEGILKSVSSNNPVAFLLRDVVLIAILGKLLFGEGPGRITSVVQSKKFAVPAVVAPIFLFILVSAVQILNPTYDDPWTNFLIGLGGIHMRILPMVLLFAAYRMIERREQVERFHRLIMYLGLIVAVVLLVQVVLGPSRWASMGFAFYSQGAPNVYSPNAERAGVPRVSSTAQDAGAAAWFVLTALLISLNALTRSRKPDHSIMLDLAATGLLVLALALTFTRTAYMGLMLGGGAYLLLRRGQFGGRLPVIAAAVLLMVGLLAAVVPDTYMDAIAYRAQMSVLNPVMSYTSQQGGRFNLLLEIPSHIAQYPLGAGLGRTGPGQATFEKWFPDAHFFMVENGFGAVIFESSLIAGLAVAWIFGAILLKGLSITRHLRDEKIKGAATSMLVCVFVTFAAMFSMNPLDASPFNGYLWFLSGVLLALPKVEENEARAAALD